MKITWKEKIKAKADLLLAKWNEGQKKYKNVWEFARYALVSLFTKFVNIFGEALVRFIMEPWAYLSFWALIWGTTENVTVSMISTVAGFLLASVVEYFISCVFVFEKNKKGNSVMGFVAFLLLSLGGMVIHILGKYVGETLLGCPWIAVNIVCGFFVLAYNYVAKKFLLFNDRDKK